MKTNDTLYHIDDKKLCETVRRDLGQMQSGTYTLIGLDESGKPMTIRRFLADDSDGVLYYGMSRNVPNRIGQLRQTICSVYGQEDYCGGNHVAGWKMAELPDLKSIFPTYDRYRLCVRACQEFKVTGEAHWSKHEADMLKAYRLRFGEHPPLNG